MLDVGGGRRQGGREEDLRRYGVMAHRLELDFFLGIHGEYCVDCVVFTLFSCLLFSSVQDHALLYLLTKSHVTWHWRPPCDDGE